MCEKRPKKVKTGSYNVRLREARRLQRLGPELSSSSQSDESRPSTPDPNSIQPIIDKENHTKVMLGLAWRTLILMQKNQIIKQMTISLKKETSEYIANVMKNPESRKSFLENLHLRNLIKEQGTSPNSDLNMEPSP